MKLKNLFLAAMALFAFTACTDTPDAPYDFPTEGGNGGTTEEGVYINETFTSDFGVFTPVETVGDTPWIIDYKTAKATSYIDGTNKEATSWLISSPVDFTNETEAYVAFEYIIRYSESGKVAANHQLLISDNYTGDPAAATWKDIPYGAVEGADWATFYKANVAVPAEFLGKSGIVFALRYTATTKASTWEVKNFKVAHGTAAEPEEPEEAQEYTVAEALAAFTGVATPAIVKGYIVGSIDDKSIDDANFSGNAVLKTNLLIADNADETDIAKCLAVQLPSGDVRNALNLVDNPGNYKKLVTLTGSLEKYFGVPGLKTVSKYEIEGVTPEEPETPEGAYINETFATDFGAFTTQETVGNYPWIIDYSTAKATSYIDTDGDGKADTNKEATSWLVSPTIDLTNETEAYIAFEYIIRYAESGKVADNHQLLICNDFSGDVATASWVNIPYGAVEGVDWNTFYKANVAVPADFLGKSTVTLALRYTATTKAGTWEVKNFVVAHGAATGETPEEPETPDTPDTPEGISTIADVISSGEGTTAAVQGTIVATYARGFIVKDNTASILVYLNEDKGFVEGDVVTVSGTISMYGGLPQFPKESTVEKTGTATVEHPTATTWTGADLDAYLNNPAIKYVEYTGTLTISGNYYNVEVEGASTAVGSIQYPKDGVVNAASGSVVKVTGYAIGVSGTKYVSTMAVKIETVDGGETPEEPEEPETPDTPTGDNILANGGFEEWNGSVPTAWGKDDSNASAHSATIAQSTEAYEGNYSVIVNGDAKSNKRLASKSYTLPAGTYTYSIYTKTNGSEAGHCRIGYVPIADGKAGTYVYEEAPASAVSADWTVKTLEFTLTEETTIAFVVMNNKTGNGASFLVDNATLTVVE